MADREAAPCPICGKTLALQVINSHIDICLKQSSEERSSDKVTQLKPISAGVAIDDLHQHGVKRRISPSSAGVSEGDDSNQSILTFSRRGASLMSPAEQPLSTKMASSKRPRITVSSADSHKAESSVSATKVNLSPLADTMRPTTIDNFVGQEAVVGKGSVLRTVVESGHVPSLVFWGPPGCGKVSNN